MGLVSGACLAEKGHNVVCVDVDSRKVDRINGGNPPIHERGLKELLRRNLNERLKATTNLREAVIGSDLSMIAVGTPFNGKEIDLRFIREAAIQIGEILRDKATYHVVVVKSTVVPGTTEEIVAPLLEEAAGKKSGDAFGVGMNPEFLREGEAIQDFLEPDRIVLGGIDERTLSALDELYRPFDGVARLRTNPRTAEAIKYTSNALLATMISFSNEIGNLCAGIVDVDVAEVMRGVHLDRRLSPILENGQRIKPAITTYLEAGCGFGGSCFPKDVKALIAYGRKAGNAMRILEAVIDVNVAQPRQILRLLRRHFPVLAGIRVAVLGLAFKPGTDDMRESPAIPVVRELKQEKALIRAFDPVAVREAQAILGDGTVSYPETLAEAVDDADAVIILTRWPEFNELPLLLKARPVAPLLIDGRRMLDKRSVPRYEGIGLRVSSLMSKIFPFWMGLAEFVSA